MLASSPVTSYSRSDIAGVRTTIFEWCGSRGGDRGESRAAVQETARLGGAPVAGGSHPHPLKEERPWGLCSTWLCWGWGRWLEPRWGCDKDPQAAHKANSNSFFLLLQVCSLPAWEGTGSCDISALPSTMSPCQEPSLAPVPKHRETTDKNRGVATPLCCHKSSWLKINCR